MQGVLRVSGRAAKITLRMAVNGLPADTTVDVTDLMLQPGGVSSGWLPHTTELPWSAGVTSSSGGDEEMLERIQALQAELNAVRSTVGGHGLALETAEELLLPASPWRVTGLDAPEPDRHPLYGPVYWYDITGASGNLTFTTDTLVPALGMQRAQRIRLVAITDNVSNVETLRGRPDLMNGNSRTGSPLESEFDLADGDAGVHTFDLDYIQPGNRGARASITTLGANGATGRLGLCWPAIGHASERSA